MKHKRLIIIIVVLLVLAGLGLYGFLRGWGQGERRKVEQGMPMTMKISRGSIVRTIDASGSISGARQIDLTFSQGGQIKNIFVNPGDYVQAGTILATMDDSQQELALLKANNSLELAKIDGTAIAIRERELDLKIARANMDKTKIIAPFAGLVVDVAIEAGEVVTTNNSVLTLLDNSRYFVHVTVDELDMEQIKLGQPAIVTVDALGKASFEGEIADIGWTAQTSGGLVTVPVSIVLLTAPADIKVGYSATVLIETIRVDEVFKLPVEAVVRQGNRSTVTVLREGEHVSVAVQTGLTDGREVEIVAGLKDDDQVVVFNYGAYNPGGANSAFGPAGFSQQFSIGGRTGR